MAGKDYNFKIFPPDLTPIGPIGKENLDVIRLTYDFTEYLDIAETVQSVQFPTIAVANNTGQDWRADFPIECAVVDAVDTYPLLVVSEAIVNLGKSVELRVNAGTPLFTYVLSFLIVASGSLRHKQVDTLIRIEAPVNPLMVGPGSLDPDTSAPIIVNGSIDLPMGFDGLLILENISNTSGIIITLPPNPIIGQMLEFIDALGKDAAYPVTFQGAIGAPIDSDGRLTFVSSVNYDALRWKWMGSNWHIMSVRFGFLA